MAEHITEWLGAYHDGELRGARLRQAEQHLMECAECRSELEATRGLSALLRETPPVGEFLPTERFVSNLTLNLPRRSEQNQPRKWIEIGWQLIPIGLLGAWLFIQIAFSLSDTARLVMDYGLFNGSLSLHENQPQMQWFAATMDLFGNEIGAPGRIVLSAVNDAQLFAAQITGRYVAQAFLAALYLGWLFSWWTRYSRQFSQSAEAFPSSNV